MINGELKKRAKYCLPDWFEQTNNDNYLTQSIDEAKKEFPVRLKVPEFMKFAPETFGCPWSMKEVVEIKDWLERWFGSENENNKTLEWKPKRSIMVKFEDDK